VEGPFLYVEDGEELRAQAVRAEAEGAGIVLLGEGPMADPIVLEAGLGASVEGAVLGVRVDDPSQQGRPPAMLAREVVSLDLVSAGRSVLCSTPPFSERLGEAIALCGIMWGEGDADGEVPHFPVESAVDRPCPTGDLGRLVTSDLTNVDAPLVVVIGAVDLLVRGTDDPAVCRVERV
jgi:hypothetical protein